MISLISALVLILVGIILKFYPPKEINSTWGYRTKTSMKNLKIWNIAQRYGAYSVIIFGLSNLLLGLWSISTPLKLNNYDVQLAFIIIGSIVLIIVDETLLRKIVRSKQ